MHYSIGIDIGGTKCAVILGRLYAPEEYAQIGQRSPMEQEDCPIRDGNGIAILDRITFPTRTEMGPDYALGKIFQAIEDILQKNGKSMDEIHSMGISCGGPLSSKKGLILSPPNLPGWDNIPIVRLMEERFGVRTRLQNDANACALAEWKFGAAKGYSNVIFLTFGTGMGAGLILDGRLYSGTSDMAGEVGHIRLNDYGPVGFGKAGTFEGFCSGGGIAQLARIKVLEKLQQGEKVSFCEDMSMLQELNAKVVAEAAEAGDELAGEIYRISGEYLGRGLSILMDVLNPEIIVIGSIFARSTGLLWPWAREVINRESLIHTRQVCKIVPAGLGDSIGDYAALAVAASE